MNLATDGREYRDALEDPAVRVVLVQAAHAAFLKQCPISLAINIASMQEMDPPVINDYFDLVRAAPGQRTAFHCCNRIEKVLSDGTRIRFF